MTDDHSIQQHSVIMNGIIELCAELDKAPLTVLVIETAKSHFMAKVSLKSTKPDTVILSHWVVTPDTDLRKTMADWLRAQDDVMSYKDGLCND